MDIPHHEMDCMYNGRIIFNETACIGYDPSHNLVIINKYNGGVLLPDINFSINYSLACFSCNNPI